MDYYLVTPSSNGTTPLVRGPYRSVSAAYDERFLNGEIVCAYGGARVAYPERIAGEHVFPAIMEPFYVAIRSTMWLWDWENKETSPMAYRFATEGGTIA